MHFSKPERQPRIWDEGKSRLPDVYGQRGSYAVSASRVWAACRCETREMTDRRRLTRDTIRVALAVGGWIVFALAPIGGLDVAPVAIIGGAFVGISVGAVIIRVARGEPKRDVAWQLGAASSVLLWVFASLYLALGANRANFGHVLTHVDCLYLAFGTLTTSGTGHLSPNSQAARAVVTAQYGADLLFIVVAVGLAMAALAARPTNSPS